MNKKIKILSLTLVIGIGFGILGSQVTKGASKDEADIQRNVSKFLKYEENYQQFPSEKNVVAKITTDELNSIIDQKKKEIDKTIKVNSKLYTEQCRLITLAFQNQNITTKDITNNLSKESKDIIAEKERKGPMKKQTTDIPGLARSFGGTATEIIYKKIEIVGNTAHVDVTHNATVTFGETENGGWKKNTVSNSISDSIDLEKDSSGNWLLVNDISGFTPGYGP